MADYKRLVSYMYRYENNTKCNNIGYARIETRNGQCKITIHIKALHYSSLPIHAYMYLWVRGKMICISMGVIEIRNGIGDFKVVTNVNDLMESGFRLDEMSGILIYVSESTFYGTEWDDQLINCTGLNIVKRKEDIAANKFESLQSDQQEKENQEEEMAFDEVVLGAAELPNEEVHQSEISPDPVVEPEPVKEPEPEPEPIKEPEPEPEQTMEYQEVSEPVLEEEDMNKLDLEAEESFEEVVSQAEQQDVEVTNISDTDEVEEAVHKVDVDPIKSLEFLTGFQKCESDEEEKEIKVQIQQLQEQIVHLQSVIKDYHVKKEELKAESLRQNELPVVSRIFEKYPKLEPFNDEIVEKCVKIEPQDIGIFPMENWILANNSFLLHGYYSYRHLIFAKMKEDNKVHYILGVPGVNHSREKNMAEMFGFKKFQKIKNPDQRDGEFGYWCLDINFK